MPWASHSTAHRSTTGIQYTGRGALLGDGAHPDDRAARHAGAGRHGGAAGGRGGRPTAASATAVKQDDGYHPPVDFKTGCFYEE
jgi:hypothetical protein